MPAPDLATKALEVHRRLCRQFGCPIPYFRALGPLSELVASLLSHRTRNALSGAAFRRLRERYPDWQAVVDAPTEEVEAVIEGVTWPELKAPRIQAVLREITERCGALSLDHLKGMPVDEARAWLRSISGVGAKTSAAVIAFSTLRGRALAVDSHHHRVAQRLGLVGPKVSLAIAHDLLAAQLPASFTAQETYDNHEVLMMHGQQVCFPARPACDACVLLDLCPTGQARERA